MTLIKTPHLNLDENLYEHSFPLQHTHKKGWADEQQYYRHRGIVSDFAV